MRPPAAFSGGGVPMRMLPTYQAAAGSSRRRGVGDSAVLLEHAPLISWHTVATCCGLFPSPLWGGARGGGPAIWHDRASPAPPPSPTLPRKGGGSTPSVLHRC